MYKSIPVLHHFYTQIHDLKLGIRNEIIKLFFRSKDDNHIQQKEESQREKRLMYLYK